uniref:Peptidase A2 domain-containing protein n=1 Tax=Chrysotila carterae TaxID=13221 RepID=A0A7S4B403_CHRCT
MRAGHSSALQLMLAITGAALNAAYIVTSAAGRPIATHVTATAVSERAGLIVMGRPLRAAEVKRRLRRFNIATDGLFEAEALRAALAKSVPEALGSGHAVPLTRLGASRGAMGAGVVVDESKCFWAVRLETEVAAADASPLLFVLDSAASHSLISTDAARALGASATGVTATSATATADTRQQGLSQVDLGKVRLSDGFECGALQPVVMDVPVAAAGLLGLDFLSRFDIELVLERAMPRAVFHPKGTARSADSGITRGMSCLKGRRLPRSGLIVVPLRMKAQRRTRG